MKRTLVVLILSVLALGVEARAGEDATTFYVQLVRGTDTGQAPGPRYKRIGPKLAQEFCPVFNCKGFWEIKRRQVAVRPGHAARVELGNGREAEIDLRSPKERTVTAFQNGKLVDRTVSPAGQTMTIIGGNRDRKSVWFIVVRRDKPED